jgi:hypothetical protein
MVTAVGLEAGELFPAASVATAVSTWVPKARAVVVVE